MPKNCNDIRNEFSLSHQGTAQKERAPFALQADYVHIDERSFADWIVFVRDYARFIKYYNVNNIADGNWEAFWSANPAIVLANLAAAPIDDFRTASRELFIELQHLDNQTNDQYLQRHFKHLFDLFSTLAWQLDRHIQLLPDDLAIKNALRSRVSQKLAPALKQWIAWYKYGAGTGILFNDSSNILSDNLSQLRILGSAVISTEDFYSAPPTNLHFSDDWLQDGETDWSTYITAINTDANVFGTSVTTPDIISFAIRHYFFTNIYEQFLQSFSFIVKESEKALQQILHKWNHHEPHFALFLASLRLFQKEQAYLNTLTDRHLRFYFERVLRLQAAKAKPAKAYLTVELAKHIPSHLLANGTQFKAGKDETGQEIFFELQDDFVANKAKVTALRSIFKTPNIPDLYQFGDAERSIYKSVDHDRYYASPVSNSAFGLGEEELTSTGGQWHPFVNKTVDANNNTWKINMPKATIGFAIASHYLYLTQGARRVTLKFEGSGLAPLSAKQFQLSLSTEKGWWQKKVTVNQDPIDGAYRLSFIINADEDAILPFSNDVHEGAYETDFPVLKAELIHKENEEYNYQTLKDLQLSGIELSVDVEDKRNMSWSGSTGPLDVSKPFHPFGPSPGDGAVFVMGDKEVFQKKSAISLSMKWKERIDANVHFQTTNITTKLSLMNDGRWTAHTNNPEILATSSSNDITTEDDPIIIATQHIIPPDFTINKPYNNTSNMGFLRFRLNGDWGHAKYPTELAKYAKGDIDTAPLQLYDPKILDISLNYSASQSISLISSATNDSHPASFYHIHPFGIAKQELNGHPTRLFPQLVPQTNTNTPEGTVHNVGKDGGEFLIGIENLEAPQVLSLLVQIAEGSADPLQEKPENHVKWWYLKDNQWVLFEKEDINDSTNGLLQTGLIRFSVPKEITQNNTILPAGKAWLRASVETAVEAVSQIIGVHTQGFKVQMIDNKNDPNLGALPMEAGSIAKLRNPQGAVKKVEQLYATFGSSAQEDSAAFYTRSSEHLRHKQRAINRWDYERMLLQEFPQLHKVKCLNHLRYEPNNTTPIYRELAPGHITIVSVTDTRQQNAVDPLRPYTPLADLENMAAFLKKHTSCFAQLHVRNPVFEPVVTSFKVCFYDGLDESFYEQQLNDDIIQYLSPWAFSDAIEIDFDGQFYKSAIVNFIEERSYVDFIEDFKLSHSTDSTQIDVEEVKPSKQVSILVSARQHDIEIIDNKTSGILLEDCACSTPTPIVTGGSKTIILLTDQPNPSL